MPTDAMEVDASSSSGKPGGATKKKSSGYQVPFVEKWRPKTLDDVVGNEETVSRLRAIAKTGNLPNLILSGPPGTGYEYFLVTVLPPIKTLPRKTCLVFFSDKRHFHFIILLFVSLTNRKTTSVHALARQLLGSAYKNAVLELNASDARGIDVVRNKIKSFAMNKVTLPPGRHKIIILDEADSMTAAAQQALRRTMELFSSTTRFCLACNISTKIIEAIQSRAAILRYSRLTHDQVLECLLRVCKAEGITYNDAGLEAILFTAEGDMRHALNNLQASYHLTSDGMITQEAVFQVCDQPHPKVVAEIITKCQECKTLQAVHQMKELCSLGYATSDIIGTLFKVVKANTDLPEALKLEFLREIGFTHMRIADGVNSTLQLYGLVARLSTKQQDSSPMVQ